MSEKEYGCEDTCRMRENLITELAPHISSGLPSSDVDEAGKVVDMIKDLAQHDYYIAKACYYETVVKAMKERNDRYGYVSEPSMYDWNTDNNMPAWWNDMKSGEFDPRKYRMGYTPNVNRFDDERYGDIDRYGKPYREWKESKRHYRDSNSATDKEDMTKHAREHIANSVATMREIWGNAEPELRKQMKADLQALIGEMTT